MNVVSISLSKLNAQILCPLCVLFFFFLINLIDRVLFSRSCCHSFGFTQWSKAYGETISQTEKNNNIKPKEIHLLTKSVSCKWVREYFNTYGNAFRKNKFAIVIFNSAVNRSTSFFFLLLILSFEKNAMNSACERIWCHIDTLPWIILHIWNLTCCTYSVFLFVENKKWPALK